jgi:hypothetical protein
VRPERDILLDYRRILDRIYDPTAYAGRLERLSAMFDCSGRPKELPRGDRRREYVSLEFVHGILGRVPEAREVFWNVFRTCRNSNPGALRHIMALMTLYTHLGPFSRFVMGEIDRRVAALDCAAPPAAAKAGEISSVLA